MTLKTIPNPELESLINKSEIEIKFSRPGGVTVVKGIPIECEIPWSITLLVGKDDLGYQEMIHKDIFSFVGYQGGIISIEHNGKKLIYNERIPVPYPTIELWNLDQLNYFRKQFLGEGFEETDK